MSPFYWGLIAGLFIGAVVGFMAAALLAMSSDPVFPGKDEENHEIDTGK